MHDFYKLITPDISWAALFSIYDFVVFYALCLAVIWCIFEYIINFIITFKYFVKHGYYERDTYVSDLLVKGPYSIREVNHPLANILYSVTILFVYGCWALVWPITLLYCIVYGSANLAYAQQNKKNAFLSKLTGKVSEW